ncbi:hypothetical protein pb186bvf_017086 [Paramecium bursaria]
MNSERRCTVLNHRNSIATHICIFKDCNKDQRWVCGECILNNTHQHGITSKNHILHYSDLPQKIKPQQSQMEINLKQMVKLVEDSISFQQNLKDVINENLESCTKNRKKAENVTQQQIFASSSQEIQELLFPSFKINQTQIADCQSKILTNRQQLDKGFRTILDNQINYQEVQVIPQQVIKIEQNVEKIYSAQVFPNGQYIAFGGDDSQLYIQHLKQNDRNIINIGEKIRYIQVSNDSKQIFVGTVAGSIINLNEQSNFQFLQIFRYHTNQIFQILIISQSIIITSSYDETIVIFDFIAKNALNTIRLNSTLCDFQNNFYYCIDYSFDKQLIAGGSNQQKITLWNYDGSVYLQHFQSINTDTRIIQFSQDYKYLMTLDSDSTSIFSSRIRNTEIKIWSIDYERGALNLIKRHREDQNIYNFSFLQNDQFLCLILENTIKLIRAIDYSTVNQIQHGIHDIFPFRTKQLDSMNPIVVKGKNLLNIVQLVGNF